MSRDVRRRIATAAIAVLLLPAAPAAFGQGVYVPGPWFDEDKYNDNGYGRTKNYWSSLLGPNSFGDYLVHDVWYPNLAWSDFLPADTNRNYAIDPGETWEEYQVGYVETGEPGHHQMFYWYDLDGDNVYTAADARFTSLPWDANNNYFKDEDEDWSVWRVADDNSCWAATAANLMSYIDGGTHRYHESVYVSGIDHGIVGTDLRFWTRGGQVDEMLDAWNFDDSKIKASIAGDRDWWSSSPFPYIRGKLKLGIPVGLSVSWGGGGAHAFTVYGIDETTRTLLIADSDSDRSDTEFYEISYRYNNDWFEIDWDNDGNWNGDMVYIVTSLGNKTTGFGGDEQSWLDDAWANGRPGSRHVAAIGSQDPLIPAHVRLEPVGSGPNRQTEASAGRLIIAGGSSLTAEAETTLRLGSLHVRQNATMTVDGSAITVDSNATCDGRIDVRSGYADLTRLFVGTQTPGLVTQSDGIVQAGALILGWDPLVQGGLQVAQGSFASTPEGEYRLSGGSLLARVERIGDHGVGVFRQTGGIHQFSDSLTIGLEAGSQGSYLLSGGGLLKTGPGGAQTIIGDGGWATLSISDFGRFEAQGDVIVGRLASSDNNDVNLSDYARMIVSGDEYLGVAGSVDFTQNTNSSGLHSVTGTLRMAWTPGSDTDYLLLSGPLAAATEIIGVEGTARFVQQGGRHEVGQLVMAEQAGATATYLMTGGILQVSGSANLGLRGSASILQSNADVTVQDVLSLGGWSGAQAQYLLGGSSTLEVYGNRFVGRQGEALFRQTGGIHGGDSELLVAHAAGSRGTYELQAGTLSTAATTVGREGSGIFLHTGGTQDARFGLTLGRAADARGEYNLDGGSLHTLQTVVGRQGIGQFTQSGGSHVIDTGLYLGREAGAMGVYQMAGGTLDVRHGTIALGSPSATLGSFTMTGGTVIADRIERFNTGTLRISAPGGTLRVNDLDLSGIPNHQITLDSLDIGHGDRSASCEVVTGPGQIIFAQNLSIGVSLRNEMATLRTGGQADIFTRGLYLGYGDRTRGELRLVHAAGVNADHAYVGYLGEGTVHQSAGTFAVTDGLYLGGLPGATGYYTLSGGTLQTRDEVIGLLGEGIMSQWGGTHQVTGTLFIGHNPNAEGRFTLDGGSLTAGTIRVGGNGGRGALTVHELTFLTFGDLFVHTGGTVRVDRDWMVSSEVMVDGGALLVETNRRLDVRGGGRISLSDGYVVADSVALGAVGGASFAHSGGVHAVAGDLIVGETGGANYVFAGGGLSAGNFTVGHAATGSVLQLGGDLAVAGTLHLGREATGRGVYDLFGGSIETAALRVGGEGQGMFNWSGGTLTAGQVEIHTLGQMDVAGDWVFGGQMTVAGGRLDMPAGLLALTPSQGNWGDTPALVVSDGFARLGGLYLRGGEALLAGGTTTVAGEVTMQNAYAEVSGGSLTAGDVRVSVGSDQGFSWDFASCVQSGGTASVGNLALGYRRGANGFVELSGSAELSSLGCVVGAGGSGQFSQLGGTHAVAGMLSVGESHAVEWDNLYELGGEGLLVADHVRVGYSGWGRFSQTGGLHRIATSLDVGPLEQQVDHQCTGDYDLYAGRLEVPEINIGADGLAQHDSWAGFQLGDGELDTRRINVFGSWAGFGVLVDRTIADVAVKLRDGGTFWHEGTLSLAASSVEMRAGQWYGQTLHLASANGTVTELSGYGYVELDADLRNGGRVIADGFGGAGLLDLSNVAGVTRDEAAPETAGWFARNGGTLLLPGVLVREDGACTFGDDPSAGGLGLINSVRMTLQGVEPGDEDEVFLVSLLAADHADLPAADLPFIGVWDFTVPAGMTFEAAGLTFRYDDLLLADMGLSPDVLKVLHFDGLAWLDVTGGIDAVSRCIFTQAVDSFSLYAVAVPEPAAILCLAPAWLAATCLRTRRRTRAVPA